MIFKLYTKTEGGSSLYASAYKLYSCLSDKPNIPVRKIHNIIIRYR